MNTISESIVFIMASFAVLGALDRIFGNRFGLGTKFEEGISNIAGLSIAMVGILSLSPVLGNLLQPIIVPIFKLLGADAAMFAGCFFANDGGAPALAEKLTNDVMIADFSGLIVGSMMGVTIIFTLPVAMNMIEEADCKHVILGILSGLITIPVGCLVGGLVAGISIGVVLQNLIPIIILALLIAVGLWKFKRTTIIGFQWFAKLMMGIIILGLAAGIFEELTGIVLIQGMNSIKEGFAVVADIAIVLAGAYPLMYVVEKVLRKPILALGKLLSINETSVTGMLASLVNSLPMFSMIKDMDARGKVISIAFSVSAGFALGDHLGFTAGYKAEMIIPMIVGKVVGGIAAVVVSMQLTKTYGKDM